MSRLPVTESSKNSKVFTLSNSATAERNRLMSWNSTAQELTKPVTVIPSSKISVILRPIVFVERVTNLILGTLVKVPYALLKLGYEIAKLFTRGLSSIRSLLLGSKKKSSKPVLR
jgi:hypothetical protein